MQKKSRLRYYREKSGKTQTDIARFVSAQTGIPVTQSTVSRWEEDPASIPAKHLQALSVVLGVPMDQLLDEVSPEDLMAVDAGRPYRKLFRNIDRLTTFLGKCEQLELDLEGVPTQRDLVSFGRLLRRKPNVGIAGQFDAGKSRLCNALLGRNTVTTRYTPTTSLATWVVHVDDRPSGCTDDVYILRGHNSPVDLIAQETFLERVVASGGAEVLEAHGTHQGDRAPNGAHVAVVFSDARILHACNLIDMPGENKDARDSAQAAAALQAVDVLIYMSPATGFLNTKDIAFLRQYVRRLPIFCSEHLYPLANLFIVASHAHPNIADADLELIMSTGAQTFYRELRGPLQERAARSNRKITEEDCSERIFPFWFESQNRRKRLQREIKRTLNSLIPTCRAAEADAEVERFRNRVTTSYDKVIKERRRLLSDEDSMAAQLRLLLENEPERARATAERRSHVRAAIERASSSARSQLSMHYMEVVSIQWIEDFIQRRYKADRKAAQEHVAGAVLDEIQSGIERDSQRRAEELSALVDEFLGRFIQAPKTQRRIGIEDSDVVGSAFDPKAVFIGGLASVGTIGALSVWTATLGNLGGYIAVAKVASLLSSLGISVGGSAALVSLVAGLGGPGVFGIALALGLGWIISSIFGDSWERRLAKKVCEVFKENSVLDKLQDAVARYWRDTGRAFETAADQVEIQYVRQLRARSRLVDRSVTSRDGVVAAVGRLEELRAYFCKFPWEPLSTEPVQPDQSQP